MGYNRPYSRNHDVTDSARVLRVPELADRRTSACNFGERYAENEQRRDHPDLVPFLLLVRRHNL